MSSSLQWRHNEHDGISNHQPHDCLLHCSLRHRSKKTSKHHIPGLCEGNSPVTSEFPAQRASNVENVSIWWRHHVFHRHYLFCQQPPMEASVIPSENGTTEAQIYTIYPRSRNPIPSHIAHDWPPVTHLTTLSWAYTWNLMRILSVLILILMIQSGHNFAHVMTA